MENIKIGNKLLVIVAVALLGMVILVGVGLSSLNDTLVDDRRVQTRNLVETAHGVATTYAGRAASGQMSEDEAKALTIAAVSACATKAVRSISSSPIRMVRCSPTPMRG